MEPIKGARVASRQQGGKTLSYLEAYDVRAHLIRVFGFGGFDAEVLDYDLAFVREYQNEGREMQEIAYKARVRLVIRNPEGQEVAQYTECAVGSASGGTGIGDLHDNALKTAVSDALKRCAINLGSQFGLGLYDQGSRAEVVRKLVTDPRPQVQQELSDEQRAVLSNSLGATEVPRKGTTMMEFQETPADPTEYLPPRPEGLHEAVDRALDHPGQSAPDMHTTGSSRRTQGRTTRLQRSGRRLCDDAMFQIEHLLVEIEALHIEKQARDEKDAEGDGSLSEQLGAEVWHG